MGLHQPIQPTVEASPVASHWDPTARAVSAPEKNSSGADESPQWPRERPTTSSLQITDHVGGFVRLHFDALLESFVSVELEVDGVLAGSDICDRSWSRPPN